MKLTCFGKYGPYPKGGEATSCYMLSRGGKNILIELGCGALSKVLEKYKIADIDAIFLSHLHSDHMGDMLTLRYALKTAKIFGSITGAVPVYLPAKPDVESALIAECDLMDTTIIQDDMSINLFGLSVSFAKMPHPYESYAMRFSDGNKVFVYSGDTKDNDRLAVFAKDADLFLMEAALLEKDCNSTSAHLSAVDAGKIGRDSGAKRMLATHLFPEYEASDIICEVRKNYKKAEMIEENKVYEV